VGADTNHIAILKYVTIALKRAKQAGIKTIIWGSGNSRKIPDGFDKNLATRQFIQLAAKIALIAQKNDVVICLEALNRLETNFINNLTEGLEIVKAVNQPNFKLNIDIYHMLKENETPEIIEMVAPYIAHCHIAEKENRTPPGIAGDNFIPYLNALKKTNYQGNISIECQWTNFEKEAPIAYSELVKQLK
jgi:sugar phosphate isomerase/epimerase